MLIIGDNEVQANGVTVRSRKEGELGCLPLDDVFQKLITEVATKAK
jgi:threonyl-tRNA synthetase